MNALRLTTSAVLAAGLALAAVAALASERVMTQNGHDYVCTGVGGHARADPRWRAFPLKLVFANRAGEYLSDVSVRLTDAAGLTVLETQCDAPWLLAKLEVGRYEARVETADGVRRTVELNLSGTGQTLFVIALE